ncbi:MAG: hypothetical protein HWN67_23380 [Candidatus Helarchaeota archaeon]|nr:hypothetical protein [Candidatus Helarchaeota archaeon]
MIIESIVLFKYDITIWAFIYIGIGIFLLIDDILAETRDISIFKLMPSKIQEENTLNLIGAIFFTITQIWFFYLIFSKSSQFI